MRVIEGDFFGVDLRGKFDLIVVDPPYFLSNGGFTAGTGGSVPVNKGEWDKSRGFDADVEFTSRWIDRCVELLASGGSIWSSGTHHVTYKTGFLMERAGLKILNEVIWFKPNAPGNLSKRYFVHSHETLLWARKGDDHVFNHDEMQAWPVAMDRIKRKGTQMRDTWWIWLTPASEKALGYHPTQKPLELYERIVAATSRPGDRILDPFCGSGTLGVVAAKLGRDYTGIDMNAGYCDLARRRIAAGDPAREARPW